MNIKEGSVLEKPSFRILLLLNSLGIIVLFCSLTTAKRPTPEPIRAEEVSNETIVTATAVAAEYPLAGISKTITTALTATPATSPTAAPLATKKPKKAPKKKAKKEKEASYSEEDLLLVAQIIETEAGAEWLSDEYQLLVGNVFLNRVASPEFPNTAKEVAYQPHQYGGATKGILASTKPSKRAYKNAHRLLKGERFCPPSVVFQSEFEHLGSGIYRQIEDKILGTVYFSYSEHPDLY